MRNQLLREEVLAVLSEQNINTDMDGTSTSEENPSLDFEQFQTLLQRVAPPDVPAVAFDAVANLEGSLERLAPLEAFAIVAGLLTDITFHANHVRLDWAQRLLVSTAKGRAKLGRSQLHRLLNEAMSVSRIAWLEDPIEDFFTEVIPTIEGDFAIFSGAWEKAAALTENILAAFEALPDFDDKEWALRCAYSLLRLSDALVKRSRLDRWTIGSNAPKGDFPTPSDLKLRSLEKRAVFSYADLTSLGIERSSIAPFTLSQDVAPKVKDQVPGNSAVPMAWLSPFPRTCAPPFGRS